VGYGAKRTCGRETITISPTILCMRFKTCGFERMRGVVGREEMKKTIILILTTMFLCGCGTILTRTGNSSGEIYPATSVDVLMVVSAGGQWDGSPSWQHLTIGYVFMSPFWLIDIPISLVTDTIMIPKDLKEKRKYEEQRSKEIKKQERPTTP